MGLLKKFNASLMTPVILAGLLLLSQDCFARPPYNWTDPDLRNATTKAEHIIDLQDAVRDYLTACAKDPNANPLSSVQEGDVAVTTHINELRTAIRYLYGAEPVGNSVDNGDISSGDVITETVIQDMRDALNNTTINECTPQCPGRGCEGGLGETYASCCVDCACPGNQICQGGPPGVCTAPPCSPVGSGCAVPTDCCTNNCYNGVCMGACQLDGAFCSGSSDCCSNNCQSGVCAPAGVCNYNFFCEPFLGETNACPDCRCGDGVQTSDEQCENPDGVICDFSCQLIGGGPGCNYDGSCGAGEDCNNCASDCGVCSCNGNGACDSGTETCLTCPSECACNSGESCIGGLCVNCGSCNVDCSGKCGASTGTDDCGNPCSTSCPDNCAPDVCVGGTCQPPGCGTCTASCSGRCGVVPDGICSANGAQCPFDCGQGSCGPMDLCVNNACVPPPIQCPNGVCQPGIGESCSNCPDCACPGGQSCVSGVCAPPCGNGSCEPGLSENCSNCGDCRCGAGECCSGGVCIPSAGGCTVPNGGCAGRCGPMGGINACGGPCSVDCGTCPVGQQCLYSTCMSTGPGCPPACTANCSGNKCGIVTGTDQNCQTCSVDCGPCKYYCTAPGVCAAGSACLGPAGSCWNDMLTCTNTSQSYAGCGGVPSTTWYWCASNNSCSSGTSCPAGKTCYGDYGTCAANAPSNCPASPVPMYMCAGSNCIRDDVNGIYTTTNCNGSCGGGPVGGSCPDGRCEPSGGECSSCAADCFGTGLCCGTGGCQPGLGENCSNCAECACPGGHTCQSGVCVYVPPIGCNNPLTQCTSWADDGCGMSPCPAGRMKKVCDDGGPCDGNTTCSSQTCGSCDCDARCASQGRDCGMTSGCFGYDSCDCGSCPGPLDLCTGTGKCIPQSPA